MKPDDKRKQTSAANIGKARLVRLERLAQQKEAAKDQYEIPSSSDEDDGTELVITRKKKPEVGTATDVRIAKGVASFAARARVVSNQPGKGMGLMFTAVEPEHLGTLGMWISESRETSWLAANRRRSQRVLMKIPVHTHFDK